MADRERERRREKEKPRDRDHRDRETGDHRDREIRDSRDRDRGRETRDHREREARDRGRERDPRKRSRSPDRRRQGRSRSAGRSRRQHSHCRSPSPDPHRRKRHRGGEDVVDERERSRTVATSEFVDDIAWDQAKPHCGASVDGALTEGNVAVPNDAAPDELEMMKFLGIPLGFDSTKGKPVSGADVSGLRTVTKRQPRQYMNRRGGFNRPLPAERNR